MNCFLLSLECYAEDLCVISLSSTEIQQLLNIWQNYAIMIIIIINLIHIHYGIQDI